MYLCAMVMMVAWLNSLRIVSWIRRSVAESTEAVASSSSKIFDRLGGGRSHIICSEHMLSAVQLKELSTGGGGVGCR
jgi:hypothetical protein